MAGVNEGHRQRLRERMMKEGLDGFQDHEILELLLFQSIPRRDTNKIAHNLLDKFGSLGNVLNAKPEQLVTVEGISEVTACNIAMLKEVWRRYKRDEIKKVPLGKLSLMVQYAQKLMDESYDERMVVVYVDNSSNFLFKEEITSNSSQFVNVDTKSIISTVVRLNASGVLLFHCHPRGECYPSKADILFTEKLCFALLSIDSVLLDHIIFNSSNQYYSFHQENRLDEMISKYTSTIKR